MPQSRNNKSSNNLCLHSFFIFCTILIQCVPASLTFSWFVCFISALNVAICTNPVSLLAFYPGPIKAAPLHILTTAATFLPAPLKFCPLTCVPGIPPMPEIFIQYVVHCRDIWSAMSAVCECIRLQGWQHSWSHFFLPVFTSLNAFFLPSCCFRSLRGWMCEYWCLMFVWTGHVKMSGGFPFMPAEHRKYFHSW